MRMNEPMNGEFPMLKPAQARVLEWGAIAFSDTRMAQTKYLCEAEVSTSSDLAHLTDQETEGQNQSSWVR